MKNTAQQIEGLKGLFIDLVKVELSNYKVFNQKMINNTIQFYQNKPAFNIIPLEEWSNICLESGIKPTANTLEDRLKASFNTIEELTPIVIDRDKLTFNSCNYHFTFNSISYSVGVFSYSKNLSEGPFFRVLINECTKEVFTF